MVAVFNFFISFAQALNPRISDTPEQVYAWRQTVAIVLVLLSIVTLFNTSSDRGWLEWAGISGHVDVAQLENLQALIRQTREDQLVQQILDNTRRYCQAYEMNDSGGMSFAFQALQEARSKFYFLTKREYPQLMCSSSAQPSRPTTP